VLKRPSTNYLRFTRTNQGSKEEGSGWAFY